MPERYTPSDYDESIYRDYISRVVELSIYLVITLLFINGELHSNSNWFWVIIVLAFSYEFLPFFSRRLRRFTHRLPASIINYTLFSILIVFFIPVFNSLALIGFLLVAMSSYWLSWWGLFTSFLTITAAYFLAPIVQLDELTYEIFGNISLRIFVLAALGATIVSFTRKDQAERNKLVEFSTEANLERHRILSLINSMADAVIAIDAKGKIQLYNGAALIFFNTNETLSDKQLRNYLKLQTKNGRKIDILGIAQTENRIIQRDDLIFKNNLKESVNVYLDMAPVYESGPDAHVSNGFIILLRDITKIKTIEEQRDEFISIVSHELRTPIAITEANISTALLPTIKSKKQQTDLMEQAHKNILFLASLVNDITLLAHAEQGRLDTKLTPLDPRVLANELVANYTEQAKDKGLALNIIIEKEVPFIQTNPERIKEIMQDFITNAIKYTDKGSVTVVVQSQGKRYVRLGIQDSGIGISSSDQKKVFMKFYRSEDFRTREHSGTGLGLYIAKRLAELIKAKIGVESTLNKGSLFYIDVPVAKQ